MMVILCGALAYGEETVGPAQRTIPTTSAELLQLYKRAIEAKEKIQIPDDVLERAREEIKRIGTWEYRVITLTTPQDTTMEQRLNQLGQQRWECDTTPSGHENIRLVCKRPIRSYLQNIAVTDLLRLVP